MSYPQLLSIIGTIPLFSMRTFFPAFLTALFFAHPEWFPGVEGAEQVAEQGTFLAQNWLLIILGILSILEFVGDKNTDIRQFLREAEPYIKPASYLLIQFFVMSENSAEALNQINWAGFNPLIILTIVGAGAVYFLSRLRKKFLDFLTDIDADDNLFLGRIISWIEDSLVLFGFLLLVWAGVFMVICYLTITFIIIYLAKQFEKQAEAQKLNCKTCGTKIFPFATSCPNCKSQNDTIFEIGILGQRKANLTTDISKHRLNLLKQRRCPECATRFEKRSTMQTCKQCGTTLFSNPNIKDFTRYLDKKFYLILSISFVAGFIPIIGFVFSASLVSIHLLAPYRKYISKTGTLFSRLLIKLLTLIFFIFGAGLGFIAAPIYAAIRYYIIKSQFLLSNQTDKKSVSSNNKILKINSDENL
jgi:Zn finger protein HypA/HybF involved in hydrogenase expression